MARKKKKPNNEIVTDNQNEDIKFDKVSQEIDEFKTNGNITQEELDDTVVDIDSAKLQVRNIVSKFSEAVKIKTIMEKRQSEFDEKVDKIKFEEEGLKAKREQEEKKLEETNKNLNDRIQKYDEKLEELNILRVGNFNNIIDKEVIDQYTDGLNKQKELLLQEMGKLEAKQIEYLELMAQKEQEYQRKKEELQLNYQQKFELRQLKIEEQEISINNQQKQLNFRIKDFNDDEEYLISRAEEKVTVQMDNLKQENHFFDEQNRSLREKVELLENDFKYLNGKDPKELKDDLEAKKIKIYELEEQLSQSPELLDLDRLKRLSIEKVELVADIREAEAIANEYKTKYEKQKISVAEKEILEFQKDELEVRLRLQKTALDELKNEVDELIAKSNIKDVFISCKVMDIEYEHKDNIGIYDDKFTNNWLETLKHVISRITNEELYYHPDTLRTFIAGLAMSRLTILQGISGTGKTSLPKAFAQAICGKASNDHNEHYEVIEVQSGWKDRQDLLGYYNTFEKKYYESGFLKALYKANTPKFRDKPFFIILDEMNLSHPEHYFADLLSILEETDPNKRYLKICDIVNDNPKEMKEVKSELLLKIPENVWFIGTANHDETTVGFAPKTYDRANIMEMPKNPDNFNIDMSIDFDEVEQSNANFLQELKDKKQYKNIDLVIEYINADFKDICSDLDIGWGNRLDKHTRNFVPIFIALGGSEADAIDHIISSKILRTLNNRYDLRAKKDELELLKEELKSNFKDLFNNKAKKSIDIVEAAIQKIEE